MKKYFLKKWKTAKNGGRVLKHLDDQSNFKLEISANYQHTNNSKRNNIRSREDYYIWDQEETKSES